MSSRPFRGPQDHRRAGMGADVYDSGRKAVRCECMPAGRQRRAAARAVAGRRERHPHQGVAWRAEGHIRASVLLGGPARVGSFAYLSAHFVAGVGAAGRGKVPIKFPWCSRNVPRRSTAFHGVPTWFSGIGMVSGAAEPAVVAAGRRAPAGGLASRKGGHAHGRRARAGCAPGHNGSRRRARSRPACRRSRRCDDGRCVR